MNEIYAGLIVSVIIVGLIGICVGIFFVAIYMIKKICNSHHRHIDNTLNNHLIST